MEAALPDSNNTLEFVRSSPRLVAGIAAWVAGWLVFEGLWYCVKRRPYSWAEARWSMMAFVVISGSATLVTAALQPLLWRVWPYRLWTLPMDSFWPWAMAWFVTDFAYYCIHRMLHATRIGWSVHAPHHSARQLSLLDSLRSSWGEQPMGVIVFGVPLVLLGVPPAIAGFFYVFVALYQFIVHTEVSWSLGPLSGLIYTPAAHRVHHSTVRAESDSNYGGFFVVFDRIFGTWVPATRTFRPAAYGLPARQPECLRDMIIAEVARVAGGIRRAQGLANKLHYAFTRPADD